MPRKNVRLLAGIPLIAHTLRTVSQVCAPERIIVITDDDEIESVARAEGVRIMREPKTDGRATLDDVARKVAGELLRQGASELDVFLTVQPTCPFLKAERVNEALIALEAGAGSVITVSDDRHLGWRIKDGEPAPDYEARVNRQMLPPQFRESGAIIGCSLNSLQTHGTRIVRPIRLIEVGREEALDIDDFSDWAVAEYLVSRRRLLIRADASQTLGMGHAYRALAVAQELARHEVTLVTDAAMPLGASLFADYPFDVVQVEGDDGFVELVRGRAPDLVILDQLDTTAEYVRALKRAAGRVITFEDLGSGALEADLLISDLYQNIEMPDDRQLTGVANAILAPNFETVLSPALFREVVENVLVVFGGTDPSGLTDRALAALSLAGYDRNVTVVAGPGIRQPPSLEAHGLRGQVLSHVRHMPAVMQTADLAISSAGRTVTEMISLGVPVLCLCQNDKELTHTHAAARFGVVNLGLGALVDVQTIASHIRRITDSPELRRKLRARALHETAGRSNTAIIQRIMDRIGYA